MRARPEPTQLEHLSDASFLGKLLVLTANVRLDWKVIASTNTLAYLASSLATKEKSFMALTPGDNVKKQTFSSLLTMPRKKQECCPWLVFIFQASLLTTRLWVKKQLTDRHFIKPRSLFKASLINPPFLVVTIWQTYI